MRRYKIVEKKIGETPLQALQACRKADPKLENIPLTYAGRLDPMAEGDLLVLIGDECKKRKLYDHLDKEYEFEILFGLKTDTGDILGLAEFSNADNPTEEKIKAAARSFLGKHNFPYPAFSSKTVGGKPLFAHALENNLDEIDIPEKEVRIHRMKFLGMKTVGREELIRDIIAKINLLHTDPADQRLGSDFRKKEIIERWQMIREGKQEQYIIAKFKATVSSGTYIRTLAPLIAEKAGDYGLAYSIRRTKIGRYFPILNYLLLL